MQLVQERGIRAGLETENKTLRDLLGRISKLITMSDVLGT
jgi:hypothetical protein